MAADVGKRPQVAILIAHDDGGLARDVDDLEVPNPWQLGDMTGQEPVAINDALEFELVDAGIGVKRLGQRVTGRLGADEVEKTCRWGWMSELPAGGM